MKIAVIGSGHIGGRLARGWTTAGHDVTVGERGALAAATAGAEVVALAVPHAALDDVLASVDLDGKVVIDCTNAVERGAPKYEPSAAELLQRRIPGAKVVKSFNAQGAGNLERPDYGGVRAANFLCGDDAGARAIVAGLAADLGFEPIDAGDLRMARSLEALMVVWVTTAQALGTRDLAFRVLRRG